MGRRPSERPHGKFRLKTGKSVANADASKQYPIEIEYNWERQAIRRATSFSCKISEWNVDGNHGRGELNSSYSGNRKIDNTAINRQLDYFESKISEWYVKNPEKRIPFQALRDILDKKPITRPDQGKDFCEYAEGVLASEYSRKKIGVSKFKNGLSAIKVFKEFLRSEKLCTVGDSIYIQDFTEDLLQRHIDWRRNVKNNSDETINHALTPLLKASKKASDEGLLSMGVNVRLQEMRIAIKKNVDEDAESFDGKYLTIDEIKRIRDYHDSCPEPRRKQFIEMFLFAFNACGMRLVDVMTLKWSHIDFDNNLIVKRQVKTRNRQKIPLTAPARAILEHWKSRNLNNVYVFDLVDADFSLSDEERIYERRNTVTRSINQSLEVVGNRAIDRPITMHMARHSFAVYALNQGLSMTVVGRLLGHSSTNVTEKTYALFMTDTLQDEVSKLSMEITPTY